MPTLDVSEIFGDPLFTEPANTVFYIRGSQTVDAHGINQITWSLPQPLANPIVQPASGAILRILPEAAKAELAIEIFTQTRLFVQTDTTVADRILYNGRTYTVKLVEDYSNYGAGYVDAFCELLEIAEDGP